MLRTGRSFLFILSVLSLQLTLLSGGERCSIANLFAPSATAVLGADSTGMDMAAMDMAAKQGRNPSDASSPHHDEQSCSGDGSDTGCDSMMVCVFAAVISPGVMRRSYDAPAERVPAIALRTPPTEGDAPELPPPRLTS